MKPASSSFGILTCSIAALLVSSSAAQAVDFFFNVPSGDWNDPASWTPAGPPSGGGGNFAFVNNGGVANVTADIPTIQDSFVGRGAGNTGTVNHSAGVATNTGWSFIGTDGGTGTYNLTGAGDTLGAGSFSTGRIYVGGARFSNGGNGTMAINTTGTVTTTGDFAVGTRGGTGAVTMTAGTVNSSGWMIIGETHDGVGGSNGNFTQNGGEVNVSAVDTSGRLWIGSREGGAVGDPASNGTYTINGGNLTARTTIIGRHYTGTFNQNGGVVTLNQGTDGANGDHRIAEAAGSIGFYNLTDGILNTNANFQIGASGTGTFTQTGGTVNAANFPVVGRFVGGVGVLDVSAGDFNQTVGSNDLIIGEEGNGTLNVSGSGAVNVAGDLRIGTFATGIGAVDQSGGEVNVTGVLAVQELGTGSYNFSGGTLAVDGSIEAMLGIFGFTGGEITRSNAGVIDFNGSLLVANNSAGFKLDDDKTFDVSGLLDITTGITFDVTGLLIPAYDGVGIDTGTLPLGVVGSIAGTFTPGTTSFQGLINAAGANFISEAQGEGGLYDPSTDSVFWVQEDAGAVTLQYSVVPEPGVALSLVGGLGMLMTLRRRRS